MTREARAPSGTERGGGTEAPSREKRRTRVAPERYLDRIGLAPETVESPDLDTLERLQGAHVTAVPFENLSIVADPRLERTGSGVELSIPHLYEKIVDRGRGGYCFELNGLFHCLLAELGYSVDRVAARITGGETTPANHHSNVVELDERYVVDAGMGTPMLREPVPIDGSSRTDEIGVEWRVVGSDRPDATYRLEYSRPDDDEWSGRFVFDDAPRDLDYFEATNDYLQSAPESTFTGEPIVAIATAEGHRKLSGDALTETVGDEERECTVTSEELGETLEREFGLPDSSYVGAPSGA